MKKFQMLAAAGALVVVLSHNAKALDSDLARFAGAKLAEARKAADAQTNKVPSFVWGFFDAVRVDDWETATNLAERIDAASGRYSSANKASLSPALQSAVWPPISETIGAYSQFHDWDNKWLHRFGSNIIASIPSGSVYFGGTDPGRFVISALVESQREGRPFFIFTQNQLVDGPYLDYLRVMYGGKLYIPTANDSQKAFQDYTDDAQQRLKAGQLKPGEDVRISKEGHVQISGQVAVMEINGRLAKVILDKNPSRDCYIEESFALDWMYPQLSPHGLIMQLHHEPLTELKEESVQKDRDYWKRMVGDAVGDWMNDATSVRDVCDFSEKVYLRKDFADFKGDAAFVKNEEAQKTFSKLRTSIASLYAWRAEHARNDEERGNMRKAADLAFRQAFVLCPYSPETVYRYAKFLADLRRLDDAILIAETCQRMGHADTEAYMRDLLRSLHQAN